MRKLVEGLKKGIYFFTFKQVKKSRRNHVIGLAVGGIWSASVLYALLLPENEDWACRGPLAPGHQELSCNSCHQPAEGSFRQQLQAKTQFMLGQRASDAQLGLLEVDNNRCLDCHTRPDDPHAVFRFREPRFAEVREALDATQCVTCHQEHKGKVVTLADTKFCANCHQELNVKADPLEISHQQLAEKALWATCMQCHDYHGNHEFLPPTSLKDTIATQKIYHYLIKGVDPYSSKKKAKAKTNVEE